MIATCARHAGRGQNAATWRNVAADAAGLAVAVGVVEGRELREEFELVIGQVVVDPPGDGLPAAGRLVPGDQGEDDDGGAGADLAFGGAAVPDVAAEIALVVAAVEVVLVAEAIDLRAAIGRADRDAAEALAQRFQRLFAELTAGHARQIRVIWDILDAVEVGDFG